MEDRIVDFRSAAAEIVRSTIKPQPDCIYGWAKTRDEVLDYFQSHNKELMKRSKKLTRKEQEESISWVVEFHTPSKMLDTTIRRMRRQLDL